MVVQQLQLAPTGKPATENCARADNSLPRSQLNDLRNCAGSAVMVWARAPAIVRAP
jgi:hypothetical protein